MKHAIDELSCLLCLLHLLSLGVGNRIQENVAHA